MSAQAYSFANVVCTLIGPGGTLILGNGAGVAEEGISIEPTEDVGTQTLGADGSGMQSLHAARPARVTIRLLKTSPTNAALSALFAIQTSNASLYGNNTLGVADTARLDIVTCSNCSFAKFPMVTWAKDGNFNEWTFNAVRVVWALGAGS